MTRGSGVGLWSEDDDGRDGALAAATGSTRAADDQRRRTQQPDDTREDDPGDAWGLLVSEATTLTSAGDKAEIPGEDDTQADVDIDVPWDTTQAQAASGPDVVCLAAADFDASRCACMGCRAGVSKLAKHVRARKGMRRGVCLQHTTHPTDQCLTPSTD